ncbi:MAG TPA: hypothetical protein VNA17_02240, partial [Pyrinomonadaceae bacterium]|nr:hypothetical protein [Pyrinomonadaceae bacterium]
MKRCPECRRDYYDDTLSFCLADGTELVYGLAEDEPATAVLSEPPAIAGGLTRPSDQSEFNTAILQPPAAAGGSDTVSKRWKFSVAVGVALLLAAVGIGFAIYKFWDAPDKPSPLMKITRLTTTGKATVAAISPDGRYVVYAMNDNGQQSLWMRQTATESNVQIVPPAANVEYARLIFSPDGNFLFYTAAV